MNQKSNNPGNGVREVKDFQAVEVGKYCKNPNDSQSAGTNKRNNGRHNGIAHSSENAHHNIHPSTDKIECQDIKESFMTISDDFQVIGIKR